jgi:hypothetical protein
LLHPGAAATANYRPIARLVSIDTASSTFAFVSFDIAFTDVRRTIQFRQILGLSATTQSELHEIPTLMMFQSES